jgi:parallel beta-helix repeat protein
MRPARYPFRDAAALAVALALTAPAAVGARSTLAGCDRAGERLVVETDTHLDPSCTYTKGVDIVASNVVLDCRGAVIERGDPDDRSRLGILIEARADVSLSHVAVRNCTVRGFNNNLRIRRTGAKDLPLGMEYEHPFSDIRIEDSRFYDSSASGLFVDAFVTGVILRNVEVAGSGAVGVYLEGGSKDNVVARSFVHGNGFGDVTPEGVPIEFGGVTFRYRSTGREGIAIDGSRNNRILDNRITGNSAGGIFLYKNCGEDFLTRPNGWWRRPYGADGNVIDGNVIADEEAGVWIASRAAENQFFFGCSDPAYLSGPLLAVHLDPARDNVVRANRFENVRYGIRVEDDGARIVRNRFLSADSSHQAILVGTKHRTAALGRPVDGTVIRGNGAMIEGNPRPYAWIHGHTRTVFHRNRSHGADAPLLPGAQPPINPFLFAIEFWVES